MPATAWIHRTRAHAHAHGNVREHDREHERERGDIASLSRNSSYTKLTFLEYLRRRIFLYRRYLASTEMATSELIPAVVRGGTFETTFKPSNQRRGRVTAPACAGTHIVTTVCSFALSTLTVRCTACVPKNDPYVPLLRIVPSP